MATGRLHCRQSRLPHHLPPGEKITSSLVTRWKNHLIRCHQVKSPFANLTYPSYPAWSAHWGWANFRVWDLTRAWSILLKFGQKLLFNFPSSLSPSSFGYILPFHLKWFEWTLAGGQLCLLVGFPPLLLFHPTRPPPHHQPAHPLPGAAQEQVCGKGGNSTMEPNLPRSESRKILKKLRQLTQQCQPEEKIRYNLSN